MKKFLSLLLVAIMLLAVVPLEALSYTQGTDGLGPVCVSGGQRDFRWPVPGYYNIQSCFYDQRNHCAIDISAPLNTTVVASYDGVVIQTFNGGYGDGFGNYVVLEHLYKTSSGSQITLYTRYSHLNSVSVNIGDIVYAGTTEVGKIGSTGASTGNHLDFQILFGNWQPYQTYSIDPYSNQLLELPQNLVIYDEWACGQSYYTLITELYSIALPTSSYLSHCTKYPCAAIIQVTKACNPCTLPCNSQTAANYGYESKALTEKGLPVGDIFVATALYENSEGNYWYETKFSDGTVGYVFANSTEFVDFETPWVDGGWFNSYITGATALNGTVTTTGTLDYVQAVVYNGTDSYVSKKIWSEKVAVGGNSYPLRGNTVDNTLYFQDLTEGNYTLAIEVEFSTYYSENGSLEFTGICGRAGSYNFYFDEPDVELNTYTITYNANGGSGEPAAQTKTEGVDLQLSSQIPSRDGYTFLGWSESSTATTAAYEWGDWFTGDYSTTLYAVWQKIVFPDNFFWVTHYNEWYSEGAGVVFTEYYPEGTYLWGLHVAFDYVATVNGENVYQITDISNGLADGGASALSIPDDGFVWVINAGNDYPSLGIDDADYTSPACFHMIDIATQWQIGQHFTFYDVDFSNVPTTTPDINWYDDDYDCTSLFYNYEGDLYYFIDYDLNGGEEGPLYSMKLHGQDLMITDVLPTRFGYNFVGWSANSSDSSVEYYPGDYYTLDDDVTLYAVWSSESIDVVNYTVPLASVNGYNQGVYYKFIPSVSTSYLFIGLDDASIDNTFKLYDGYGNLLAENDDDAGELQFKMEYYLNAGQAYYVFVSIWNISLYESYDTSFAVCRGGYILYNANGGSGEPGGHYVYYGMSPKLSDTVPTRDGFTFLGWSTSSYATSVTYSAGASIVPSDMTLYAVWQSNSSSAYAEGDVNGDGKVNLFDYMAVKSYCLDKNTLPEDQLERADLTGDGRVNMFDYIALKKIVIGG